MLRPLRGEEYRCLCVRVELPDWWQTNSILPNQSPTVSALLVGGNVTPPVVQPCFSSTKIITCLITRYVHVTSTHSQYAVNITLLRRQRSLCLLTVLHEETWVMWLHACWSDVPLWKTYYFYYLDWNELFSFVWPSVFPLDLRGQREKADLKKKSKCCAFLTERCQSFFFQRFAQWSVQDVDKEENCVFVVFNLFLWYFCDIIRT